MLLLKLIFSDVAFEDFFCTINSLLPLKHIPSCKDHIIHPIFLLFQHLWVFSSLFHRRLQLWWHVHFSPLCCTAVFHCIYCWIEENNVQSQLVADLPHVSRWGVNISVAPLAVGELCSSKQLIHKASNTLEISFLGTSATTGIFSNYLSISHTAGGKETPFIGDEQGNSSTGLNFRKHQH